MLSFQKNLNVTSSERRDFKLPIGSFNNKFPYMVEELPNILQSALCLRSRDFNIAANMKEEYNAKSYEPKLKKKTSETEQ